MNQKQHEFTRLLRAEGPAQGELVPLVYEELRGLANKRMSQERAGHTLQATALVNEAYMRLAGDQKIAWRDRKHFYGAAAEAMRRVLIDHARKAKSQKRGGDRDRVTLGAAEAQVELESERLVALAEALDELAREDARAAEVARLRFLSGLSVEETAQALDISVRSVHREWTYARARLFELLARDES